MSFTTDVKAEIANANLDVGPMRAQAEIGRAHV